MHSIVVASLFCPNKKIEIIENPSTFRGLGLPAGNEDTVCISRKQRDPSPRSLCSVAARRVVTSVAGGQPPVNWQATNPSLEGGATTVCYENCVFALLVSKFTDPILNRSVFAQPFGIAASAPFRTPTAFQIN